MDTSIVSTLFNQVIIYENVPIGGHYLTQRSLSTRVDNDLLEDNEPHMEASKPQTFVYRPVARLHNMYTHMYT